MHVIEVSANNLVVQHNKIIEAKYKLSVGEQRLVKLLISMIEKDDEDFKVYRISVTDLSKLLGISDKDIYRKVKVSSKKLISNVLTFKGSDDRELQVSWLSSAEYIPDEGAVELEFSPKLKPFLLQLKQHFTAYELGNVINLKHTYSIRIYELLKQYEKIGTRKFTIEHLRELLMLEEGEYKQFCDFRRWILKPAQKELKEKTDISFEWTEERKNQKCVAIEFSIYRQNRPIAKQELLFDGVQTIEEISDKQQLVSGSELSESHRLLLEYGISPDMAKDLSENYSEHEIKEHILYADSLKRDGKIQNPAGFLVDAIRKGFRDNHAEERKKKEDNDRKNQDRLDHQELWKEIKSSYKLAISTEAFGRYDAMDDEQKNAIWDDFYNTQNKMFRKIIDRDKNGIPARGMFLGYLKNAMTLPSFAEWAQANQVDVSKFWAEMRQDGMVA
jgi:plasmid replication initiation protein